MARYLEALRRHLAGPFLPVEPGGIILELGGSTGGWTLWLAGQGYRVSLLSGSVEGLSRTEGEARTEGLDGNVELRYGDMTALADMAPQAYALVLCSGEFLQRCPRPRQAIRQMKRLCRPGGVICLEPVSRVALLPDLLLAGEFAAVEDLVQSGSLGASSAGAQVRHHVYEIRELVSLLWEEELAVMTVAGCSTLLGILGDRRLAAMLERVEVSRLFALEESLSQNEYLVSMASRYVLICQVSSCPGDPL